MAISAQQAAAKGKGWVDKNNPNYGTAGFVGAEDEDDYVAPAPGIPAPAGGVPLTPPVAAPVLGPMVANPTTGTAQHDPTQAVPPPGPAVPPQGIAPPPSVPLVDTGGVATHRPEVSADGGPTAMDPNTPPATVNEAFKKALLDRLNKPIGIDPNDPTMKAQTDAFSLSQTRAKERARAAMAERASTEGGVGIDSGAFEGGLLGLEQAQGEAEAAFGAGLAGDELNRQRDELTRFMAMAGDQLNAEESRALQLQLAELDAQIQREGMAQSGGQFDKGLSEQQRQFDIEAALKRHGIDTQAGQFDRSLLEQGREADLDAEMKKLGINLQGELGRSDTDVRRRGIDTNAMLGLLQLLMGNQQFEQGEAGTNARFGAGLDADAFWRMMGGVG